MTNQQAIEMNNEEEFMSVVGTSQEHVDFQRAATALAQEIREASVARGYDIDSAVRLVANGKLQINIKEPSEPYGLPGLPGEVGLFLTASTCGGMFPQVD